MPNWVVPAIIAFSCWGLWAYLPKLVVRDIDPKSAMVWEVVGGLFVALAILLTTDFKVAFHPRGSALAVLVGVLGLGGGLAYLYAVSKGPVSIVSIFTALYPIWTIVFAYMLLHEPISLKQGVGMVLALIAIVLLAG
jgi:transporter family protein